MPHFFDRKETGRKETPWPALRKGRIETLTRISMKLKFQELLPLPRGYKANQRTCELREPVCRMAEGWGEGSYNVILNFTKGTDEERVVWPCMRRRKAPRLIQDLTPNGIDPSPENLLFAIAQSDFLPSLIFLNSLLLIKKNFSPRMGDRV